MDELQEKFARLDIWPVSALDKKHELVIFNTCKTEDGEILRTMYDSFEPKMAVQGLLPLDPATRWEWIRNCLDSGLNLKAEIEGRTSAHGLLFPIHEKSTAELGIFFHNEFQQRGIGLMIVNISNIAGKK